MAGRAALRSHLGRAVVNGAVGGFARAARIHPQLRRFAAPIQVIKNIPYLPTGDAEHLLNVYRPHDRSGPLPVAMYVHGGGFRLLSKDTHWVMATILARAGYLVFSINYRLAPRSPYPAAIEDVCRAALWVRSNANAWGGDGEGVVLAGESAGANLVTALTIAGHYERPEPWARAVFDRDIPIRAVLPACGIHQVTDMERFKRAKPDLRPLYFSRMNAVRRDYLTRADLPREGHSLADPLLILESGQQPARKLPPFMLTCGDRDPIVDDTHRLDAALRALNVPTETRFYPDQGHAFHAAIWRRPARWCWKDQLDFLEAYAS